MKKLFLSSFKLKTIIQHFIGFQKLNVKTLNQLNLIKTRMASISNLVHTESEERFFDYSTKLNCKSINKNTIRRSYIFKQMDFNPKRLITLLN